jgi:hypothetical protein
MTTAIHSLSQAMTTHSAILNLQKFMQNKITASQPSRPKRQQPTHIHNASNSTLLQHALLHSASHLLLLALHPICHLPRDSAHQ